MGTDGLPWLGACLALGAAWTVGTSWRAEAGTVVAATRGVLGGLAALWTASLGYDVMHIAGFELRWESITSSPWPALGVAAAIGLVEEGAKLTGIVLAAPTARGSRSVLRTTATVAAVFAVAEAAQVVRGLSWPVALSRAAFGPVAHGMLAAPIAVTLAGATRGSRAQLVLRLAGAVGLAALLHGLGDWSVAQPGWGRAGFAAALLAPTLWLYARARSGTLAVSASGGGLLQRAQPSP